MVAASRCEPGSHDRRGTLRGFVAADVELAAGQLWASMAGDRPARTAGFSVLEAVAYWAGQRHTETPATLSPVLAAFARRWEHGLRSAGERAMPKQFIPALPNTVDPAVDEARALLAVDWLARHAVPVWLDHAGVAGWPDRLRAMAPIRSAADCDDVYDQITAAQAELIEHAERDPVNAAPLARQAVDASAVSSAHIAARTFRCERPWPHVWRLARPVDAEYVALVTLADDCDMLCAHAARVAATRPRPASDEAPTIPAGLLDVAAQLRNPLVTPETVAVRLQHAVITCQAGAVALLWRMIDADPEGPDGLPDLAPGRGTHGVDDSPTQAWWAARRRIRGPRRPDRRTDSLGQGSPPRSRRSDPDRG